MIRNTLFRNTWNSVQSWWACAVGPTLFTAPNHDPTLSQAFAEYQPNLVESLPSNVIDAIHNIYGFSKWTMILWLPWFLKSVNLPGNFYWYSKFAFHASVFYFSAILVRGIGRFYNLQYIDFISLYQTANREKTETLLEKLTNYSFSSPWPPQFDVSNLPVSILKPRKEIPSRSTSSSWFRALTWISARTVGIRFAYPGCTGILNSLSFRQRLIERERLRRVYGIRRIGMRTRDGEFVEGFYADRRGSSDQSSTGHGDSRGEILILCCEGNAGYPEIGTPNVPLEEGYSVLGWNHPGFGSSTGLPFPSKDQNAMEAVVLFAIHRLHFQPDQIYLFGWSIGGYAVTWAAMNFPEIGGVILDATFDDIHVLAEHALPDLFNPVVIATVEDHIDLNNMGQIVHYDGPVRFIRRSMDEIISTSDPPSQLTNRSNFILIGLLKHRFPHVFTDDLESRLWDYLALDSDDQSRMIERSNISLDHYALLVTQYMKNEVRERQTSADSARTPEVCVPTTGVYPSTLGSKLTDTDEKWNFAVFLLHQHLVESRGRHCQALQPNCFRLPWSPFTPPTSPTSRPLNGTDDSNSSFELVSDYQ